MRPPAKYLYFRKYILWALRTCAQACSRPIQNSEARQIRNFGRTPLRYAPVFIIGAPRTGSTSLYQAITSCLNVLYFDNIVCSLHKHILFGFQCSRLLYGGRGHNCFKSRYGDTDIYSLHGPAECGAFWHDFVPKKPDYIDVELASRIDPSRLQSVVLAATNKYGKPLVFKNLNAGLRLHFLKRAFPEARFVFIKRNPCDVAASIYRARQTTRTSLTDWFSLAPKNKADLIQFPVEEQIVRQIYEIEKHIFHDSRLLRVIDRTLVVQYEEFCRDPAITVRTVSEFVEGVVIPGRLAKLQRNIWGRPTPVGLEPDIMIKLNSAIEKLDWKEYSD